MLKKIFGWMIIVISALFGILMLFQLVMLTYFLLAGYPIRMSIDDVVLNYVVKTIVVAVSFGFYNWGKSLVFENKEDNYGLLS